MKTVWGTKTHPARKTNSNKSHLRARRFLLIIAVILLISFISTTASATKLHDAAKAGDIKKVRSLLDSGADVNARTNNGWTPLLKVLRYAPDNTELARLLIKRGADVNARINKNWTPLLLAAWYGNTETAILLIERGADVNARTNENWTPLLKVLRYTPDNTELASNTELARLLIERGADVNARTNKNWTPLLLAAWYGNTEIAKLLIERGADINAKTNEGNTALDLARSQNKHKTAAVIKDAIDRQQNTKVASAPAPVAPVAPKITSIVDTPPSTRMSTNPNAYAVVIGIEKYRERLPDALYARSDAETMAKYLTESMGFEKRNVAVLINDRATRSDLSKYLGTWLRNRANKPDSRVFIYFSGHGAPDVKTSSAYIVPYDGDPTYLADTGYPLKKLYEDLGKLKAGEIIVALDSCFSGAGGRSVIAKGARPIALALKNPAIAAGNMVILSASSGVQASSTYEAKGHGLFTYYLLKGLQGAADADKSGNISVNELHEYIRPKVETIALEEYNNEQTPQMMDPSGLSSKMVLIGK